MAVLLPSTFPPKVKAKDGKVLDLQKLANEKKLLIMAGSVCKDWSYMNQNRQELVGKYILPFAVMLSLCLRLSPAVFFHECTAAFKPDLLARYLPRHQIMHTILDPVDFGFPVKRGRSYSALVHDKYEIVSQLQHLRRLVAERVMVEG